MPSDDATPAGVPLTYGDVGATRPGSETWEPPAGYRALETTVVIGHGEEAWERAASSVLVWGVKTRSGFHVKPGGRVALGADHVLQARLGPVTVTEPVRVVAVVETAARCGFAYGTLPGHPVSGEEAFVVQRRPDGAVLLTLRSLIRAGSGVWRPLFPALLVAQRVYRWRYQRALRDLQELPQRR
ncbi:DUF1990 family protein [Cellulomonas edaphi]|uniref:DUF1990 domain-containing protein n=1 Tax=Cellulomonas edaphi TaxID=3053468 RepID=A0ABT7S5C7_9CELL|nr:DUF1990 domain-containing protein [Cellulomons edaphi]MDM7830164.1 DUF1990 domain-containing protein [Cellulomons edaphi]